MALPKELIESDLSIILSQLGHKVTNAPLYKEELGGNAPSEQVILDKWIEYRSAAQAKNIARSSFEEAAKDGFSHTTLSYKLAVTDEAFKLLAADVQWAREMLTQSLSTENDTIEIDDINGVERNIQISVLLELFPAYGMRCREIRQLKKSLGV